MSRTVQATAVTGRDMRRTATCHPVRVTARVNTGPSHSEMDASRSASADSPPTSETQTGLPNLEALFPFTTFQPSRSALPQAQELARDTLVEMLLDFISVQPGDCLVQESKADHLARGLGRDPSRAKIENLLVADLAGG